MDKDKEIRLRAHLIWLSSATADWSLAIFASAIRDRDREADETRGVETARDDTEARGEQKPVVALLEWGKTTSRLHLCNERGARFSVSQRRQNIRRTTESCPCHRRHVAEEERRGSGSEPRPLVRIDGLTTSSWFVPWAHFREMDLTTLRSRIGSHHRCDGSVIRKQRHDACVFVVTCQQMLCFFFVVLLRIRCSNVLLVC